MASIRKLPNGRWQAQFRPVPGGKQITHTTRRKVDAKSWLDERVAAVTTGQFVDPKAGRVTFKQYFEQWASRQVWAPGTERAMRLAARSVTFEDVPLGRLVRSHVEQWIKDMETNQRGYGREKGLAPGTIRTRFNNVRAVLRAAVKDRITASDPSEGVRLPRIRKADAALNLPEAADVRKLMDSAEPFFRVFIALCAFAGLRLGEAAALKVGDIDLDERTLRVQRQVQRENGCQVEIRAPKYGSERTVYLADRLASMLRQYIADLSDGDGRRWLFEGQNGYPPHQNTIGYWWRKARAAAGHDDVRLHDLRHFYASGLIAAGCDVVTVQRALGHSSATITLNTYAHLWPSAEDRTRNAAAGLLTSVLDGADE